MLSHHLGPGVKLVGGYPIYMHEDQRRFSLPPSLDPAEILKRHTQGHKGASVSDVPTETVSNEQQATAATTRPAGSGNLLNILLHGGGGGPNRHNKVVFWNGKSTTVMDKPELKPGQTWTVPHLDMKDIGAGHFVGVSELTGAEGIALIGGKARRVQRSSINMFHRTPPLRIYVQQLKSRSS